MVEAYTTGMGELLLTLNIIVCLKWVPNTQAVRIDPKTKTLVREGVPSIINPHDLDALELALKLKDEYGGAVTVVSMAPPSALLGLEHAIGMGVDKAYLISDRAFAGADTLATSYTLYKAIERIGCFDLIMTGQETIDSSTAHIAAQLACWLNLPYIYYVVKAEYRGDGVLRVWRRLENYIEVYDVKLPAVVSVAMKSNPPRRVSLVNKIRAKTEKPIEVWSNKELKLDENCIGLKGSPTRVVKIEVMPEVPRKKQVFRGNAREAAEWLVKKLVEEGVISFGG